MIDRKVKDLMIPLKECSIIPYWFTLRQAFAIIRNAAIKFEGTFEPQAVLILDEKYRLMGILRLRDLVKGLEPGFLRDIELTEMELDATDSGGGLLGPRIKEEAQRPVTEVMAAIPTIDGYASLVKALYLMIRNNVDSVPVILDEKVAGMIRLSDIFGEIAGAVLGE